MSMLQEMMANHEREVAEVKAEIEEARHVAQELRQRLDDTIKYFNAVAAESIRAATELFEALADRERIRLAKLQDRHAELMAATEERTVPRDSNVTAIGRKTNAA